MDKQKENRKNEEQLKNKVMGICAVIGIFTAMLLFFVFEFNPIVFAFGSIGGVAVGAIIGMFLDRKNKKGDNNAE